MLNSTSYTHGTIHYDDLLRDFEDRIEKLNHTTLNLHQAIQSTKTQIEKTSEEFPRNLKRLEDKKNELQKSMVQMRRNIAQIQQELEPKRQEYAAKEVEMNERSQERIERLKSLVERKNRLNDRVCQKRQEKNESTKTETANARLTELELQTYRHALQLEIVNTNDALRFEFKCISKQVPEKIYHIALTITDTNLYTVIECQPDSVLPKVLKELEVLNQDRELFIFIKKLRQIFRQSANA